MNYLPFEISTLNEKEMDTTETMTSDSGTIYVRIGKLDIGIKQSDDGLGVIIDCTDTELCEQDLGSLVVWFDDIQELPLNEDGTHPLKSNYGTTT